jgi:putative transport protein
VTSADAVPVLLAGALATSAALACALLIGRRVLHLPAPTLAGMVAGIMTQPAVLAFASGRVADDTPVAAGYATVYPVAMIGKILLAQLLVAGLPSS